MKWYLLLIILLLSIYFDLKERIIPNILVLPFIAIGIIYSTIINGWMGLISSLSGVMIVFIVFVIPFILGGIGGGDIKLLMAIASINNVLFTINTLIYTILIGAFFATMLILRQYKLKVLYKALKQSLFNILYMNKVELSFEDNNSEIKSSIPYSIPIFIGTLITYFII